MESKVPQRIDMEDRVIGPLTLTQFFYLLFGGLFLYLLNSWTAGSPFRIIFYILAVPVGFLSIALAFVKIQDRPFIYFLGAIIKYLQRPRRRVWLKGEAVRTAQIVDKKEEQVVAPHKDLDINRVRDVSKIVDAPKENDG